MFLLYVLIHDSLKEYGKFITPAVSIVNIINHGIIERQTNLPERLTKKKKKNSPKSDAVALSQISEATNL